MLPKSLHTVRILVAVARMVPVPDRFAYSTPIGRALEAAYALGYPTACASDPLIIKAAAQLAKGQS